MKFALRIPAILLLLSCFFVSCDKELSSETGAAVLLPGGGTAEGEFGGAPSSCENTEIRGNFGENVALSGDTVLVEMNITQAGTYYITTDTVNGIYFSARGTAAATGVAAIPLVGFGTPLLGGSFTFTVKFKDSQCSFDVTVVPVVPTNNTGDYFPTTNASFWKFVSSDPSADPEDTLRNTATNLTYQINGVNYTLFLSSHSSGEDSAFYRKSSGNYYQYGDLDIAGAADNVVASEYIFLKDNVDAGTSWESPSGDADIAGNTVKLKLVSTITAKNVSATVGNKLFNNVIKVSTSEQVQLPTGWTTLLTFETWFAKGIGVINIPAPAPFYGYYLDTYQVF